MNIGILGTGEVGRTLGTKLIQIGHRVKMGARSATNEKAAEWVAHNGPNASHGTFADAAAFGAVLFNCTNGTGSIPALTLAGADNLKSKILIDVSNPLDYSKGFPPTLIVCNDDSLAEQIQRAFPDLKVVKSLNTMNCAVMVNPASLPGEHDVFVSGNDAEAKAAVIGYLKEWFGWKAPIDLGDLTSARGAEMVLALWVRLYGVYHDSKYNFKIVR
jgi:predicted dinucleotide-binding enzyme